jgi:hypothetical protein
MIRAWFPLLLAVAVASCGPAISGGEQPTPPAADGSRGGSAPALVPPGYGTLRQDDATVSIRSGAVLVKLTPLDEAIIRLLAPDTYTRLHALRESRRGEVERISMRQAELFLVSFFSYQPDASFQPEDVQLFHQSRTLRPALIIPLTSGWGQQRLAQQETQTAVYAYEGPLEYDQALTVRYGQSQSDEWRQIIVRLETERSKVLARVR